MHNMLICINILLVFVFKCKAVLIEKSNVKVSILLYLIHKHTHWQSESVVSASTVAVVLKHLSRDNICLTHD